jgi:hypothetical protein
MIMLKDLAKKYFIAFSEKNIEKIAEMLSDEIVLRDWNVTKSGKNGVLNATQNIFDSVESIDVKPINIYCEDNTIISELKIVVNDSITELVVDIITFDIDNKIASIRAYKC